MSNNEEVKELEVYRNKPQIIVSAANTRITAVKGGRRLGKTVGMVAYRTFKPMLAMPGSSGFIAGKSYRKILDHLLPEILAGWQMLGWVENEDYVVCKAPPRSWKNRPIVCPRSFDHYIMHKSGSGLHLISFDHTSTSNGLATDHGVIDESKQLDPARVDSELLKTMSGHRSVKDKDGIYWGERPEHTSLTITQDAFYGKRDFRWIDRYADSATEYKKILEIILLQLKLQENYSRPLEQYIWSLQREAVLFLTPSTLENLAVLGIDYFKSAYKNSNLLEFRASILNEEVMEIDGGFYTRLDESIHSYSDGTHNSRIDSIGANEYLGGIGHNCKLDSDWRSDLPIDLGIDYGSTHSWLTVHQTYFNTDWTLKDFMSQSPKKFTDMIVEFCKYYKPHECRQVTIYDDPAGHREKTDTPEADRDKVVELLRENGWYVTLGNEHNAYMPHKTKYRVAEACLDDSDERDERFPKIMINAVNAYRTLWSMGKAPLLKGNKEFEKDKRSETTLPLDLQWQATHLSDSWDYALGFKYADLLDESGGAFTM